MRVSAAVTLVREPGDDEHCRDCEAGGPCDWHGEFSLVVSGERDPAAHPDDIAFINLRVEKSDSELVFPVGKVPDLMEDEMEDVQHALEKERQTEAARSILTEVADPNATTCLVRFDAWWRRNRPATTATSVSSRIIEATESMAWGVLPPPWRHQRGPFEIAELVNDAVLHAAATVGRVARLAGEKEVAP